MMDDPNNAIANVSNVKLHGDLDGYVKSRTYNDTAPRKTTVIPNANTIKSAIKSVLSIPKTLLEKLDLPFFSFNAKIAAKIPPTPNPPNKDNIIGFIYICIDKKNAD